MSAATDYLAASIAALTESLRATANDPADQIRLLSSLAVFAPAPAPGQVSTISLATSTSALCRRAALVSLARACALYQPSSANDAETVELAVTALFDAEITVAADGGDLPTYAALRDLRAAVALDLNTRGAQLPQLVTFTFGVPMPALALAYRLYQDATRSDDLVARADPVHPAFMPTSFQALAS